MVGSVYTHTCSEVQIGTASRVLPFVPPVLRLSLGPGGDTEWSVGEPSGWAGQQQLQQHTRVKPCIDPFAATG